jgi:hypothetical protein
MGLAVLAISAGILILIDRYIDNEITQSSIWLGDFV